MPQKRNPDAAELVRAKTGRILAGRLSPCLTLVMKGLPLAYSKDMQEDKVPTSVRVDGRAGPRPSTAMTGHGFGDFTPNVDADGRGGRMPASRPPPIWPTGWLREA